MGSPEGFDFNTESKIEEAPIFTYTLFDQEKNSVDSFKNPDDELTLDDIYKLYVGKCIEAGVEPLAMEDLSMNRI